MLKRRQEIKTTIEKVAFGGQGISHHENFVIFVENALPGDRMKVRIKKVKKNYAQAYPIEILEPSHLRKEAECSHYGFCGGCKWQNLDYQNQLDFKKQHVIESLEHIGDILNVDVKNVIPSPLIFGYRNKMEFSFSDNRWLPPDELKNPEIKKEGLTIGLHVPRFYNRIIDIKKCWLQDGQMNRILQFSREFFKKENIQVYHNRKREGILRFLVLRKSFAFNQIMVNVVTSKPIQDELTKYAEQLVKKVPEVASVMNNVNSRIAQIAVGEEEYCILGESVIQEKIGDYKFEISANSFFQTNSLQAEKLYQTVKDFAEVTNNVVWDLYSGTGSIAIFLSDEAKKVVGFEILEDSVKDAQRNAEINQVSNCKFIAGDLRFSVENYSGELPDIIICDPPRSGMHPKVLELILKVAPQKIIYVSCNPTTLARDLVPLKARYNLIEVQPLDMFPHTYHIESVCRLEKR